MLIQNDAKRWQRLLVSAVLFIVIAAMVYKSTMLIGTLDSVLQTLFTNNHPNATGGMKVVMTLISFIGSPKMDLVWAFIIAFLLWGFKYKIPALWTLGVILGGDVLGAIVKHVIKRARPAQHMAADNGFSFPSGHVLGGFLIAGILMLVVVPIIQSESLRVICQILLVFYVALLAISRVYLYAHFPTDTIGAMLLAYAWLQIAEYLYVIFAPILSRWKFVSNSYV
ncbi:phosphatase PAP2 family protein [Lactobacillus sp. 3B(2020)]|uniref:phosphatase PAP2 family protein n=1 Tax=Lactobacillus sp. 3B(2020) TaxID=2695882 RepID=UPI0015DD9EF5|nr:phosphatase PAP2 family protein [Lactobacillus sp. 3B(2020)]QLL70664.1 phosphatase PAP2 family protein [Lactobacillus sp. 3B(2020)]